MPIFKKDLAAKADARRKQRTGGVHFDDDDRSRITSTTEYRSLISRAATTRPPISSSLATSHAGASVTTASRKPTTEISPKNTLLERSFEVAEEAASVLASVRKQKATTTTAGGGTTAAAAAASRPRTSITSNATSTAVAGPPKAESRSTTAQPTANSPKANSSHAPNKRDPTTMMRQASPRPVTEKPASGSPRMQGSSHQIPPNTPETGSEQRQGSSSQLVDTPSPRRRLLDDDKLTPSRDEDVHEEEIVRKPVIDAASLPDQSNIMIQSYARQHLQTLQAEKQSQDDDKSPHLTGGLGLGRPKEVWTLEIVVSHLDPTMTTTTPVLCYGDRVSLRQLDSGMLLGVHRTTSWQVECFKSILGNAELWMVLRVTPKGTVLLGHAAVEASQKDTLRGPMAPVQSGDPIVLRHLQTGGILASNAEGTWKLLMDSYDANKVRHGVFSDPTLLGRLQRHDRLVPSAAEIVYFVPAMVPPMPWWIRHERIFLNGSYLHHPNRHALNDSARQQRQDELRDDPEFLEQSRQLTATAQKEFQNPSSQERILVDELLGSFLGLEGQFIRVGTNEAWKIDSTWQTDRILGRLIQEMVPLAAAYARVRYFVSAHRLAYEYGYVMHAFCQSLDTVLQQYLSFIGSLETTYRHAYTGSSLSLTTLQVQIQRSLHVLTVLERAIEAVRCHKGGALLNTLSSLQLQTFQGDGLACHVLEQLIEAAANPYLQILSAWLERGELIDPYFEFMVQCPDSSAPWESRYELAPQHVLEGFFTKQSVERVLATGRYWNAVQQCQPGPHKDNVSEPVMDEDSSKPAPLQYSASSAAVASFVTSNYHKASRALLGLLKEYNLMGSLRLVKRYFLLDHGDFFLYFLDSAEDELRKGIATLSRGRVQHWLEVSIQLTEQQMEEASIRRKPKNSLQLLTPAGLRCRFAPESLTDHLDKLHAASGGIDSQEPWTPLRHTYGGLSGDELSGLDAFMIDFTSIPFPVSLVLSQRALAYYQLLFRHLFFAKHVERRLVGIWQDHQGMKELQSLRGSMGPTFLLRQRMLHFLQNLIYYMMLEVIEPRWSEMQAAIDSDTKDLTIDDIMQAHMKFLQSVLEACLLTNRDLVRALTKLMKTCLLFSDQMKLFMTATKIDDDRHSVATAKQRALQKNLNNRRGLRRRPSMDRKALQKSMQTARNERQQRIQRQTARVEREINGESYPHMISRFDQVFSDNLREFMAQLTHTDDLYHSQKVNLCIRLDYNGYVTRAMGLTTTL